MADRYSRYHFFFRSDGMAAVVPVVILAPASFPFAVQAGAGALVLAPVVFPFVVQADVGAVAPAVFPFAARAHAVAALQRDLNSRYYQSCVQNDGFHFHQSKELALSCLQAG